MYLKKLELSGFKSFAKMTVLEFPSRITAIVGPNGSGKSNITEGIRWVLGEQSMKSLRGKKGEDLIWNGSPHVPRMGKAAVTLIFDNKNGEIPLDFEEIALSRKIFRDGMGEYFINDAQVRLKDVVELMAHLGLGESKHNIISQGEVDRMLLSSARDRREMLEEALGLRVYQIKKKETERKLEATDANTKQVEALVREIAPHLKFLKVQAEKSKARGTIEGELKQFEMLYFLKEKEEIAEEKKTLQGKSEPLKIRRDEIRKEVLKLSLARADEEKKIVPSDAEREVEENISRLSEKQRGLERELGRLEGRIEGEKRARAVAHSPVSEMVLSPAVAREIASAVQKFLRETRSLLDEEDRLDVVCSHLRMLLGELEGSFSQLNQETMASGTKKKEHSSDELEHTFRKIQEESHAVGREIESIHAGQKESHARMQVLQEKLRERDISIRVKQEEDRDIALILERFRFDEERVLAREKTFLEELEISRIALHELEGKSLEGYAGTASAELKKKVERFRIKLEEVGGIDPAIIREYEETNARLAFLQKELEDLRQASESLRALIKELETHIKEDFHNGFGKIRDEFHNYFRVIFGGGRASLDLLVEKHDEEGPSSEASEEEGIDISVDLPRKRIQGLAMLSGGERALTAIALLFAITAVNPPPFLILDETDAALDEANSQRYSSILKELSKKTQLLLVTHNRETMKCAGILYGVTMGDDGVSKFLSLKFEEAEAYTN